MTLCHLRRSSNRSQPYPNDINLKKQLWGKKSKNNGVLRLVSGGGIIKAALATAAEPTTTVITKVIVKKITGETTSSNLMEASQPPQKLLQLGFASILLDPSNFLFPYTLNYLNRNYNNLHFITRNFLNPFSFSFSNTWYLLISSYPSVQAMVSVRIIWTNKITSKY